jgi:hypothetical protein
MNISAIAANGVSQASAGFQNAVENLSNAANPANPIDTVSLSDAAVAVTQKHLAYSASIDVLKIADDVEKDAISLPQ